MKKICRVTAFVLPSFSEVGPNIIAEALAAKTPVLFTKYSGYAEVTRNAAVLVDPLREEEIANGLVLLMNGETRRMYEEKVAHFSFRHSWDEAAEAWIRALGV